RRALRASDSGKTRLHRQKRGGLTEELRRGDGLSRNWIHGHDVPRRLVAIARGSSARLDVPFAMGTTWASILSQIEVISPSETEPLGSRKSKRIFLYAANPAAGLSFVESFAHVVRDVGRDIRRSPPW